MAKSLQDQLMGAGLVDKQKVKSIQKEKRKKRKQTPKGLLPEEEVQKIEHAEKLKQEKVEKDRALNRVRQEEQNRKAIKAQIKQLITNHNVDRHGGEIGFQFVVNNKIKKIFIDEEQQKLLLRGRLAIVELLEEYFMVPAVVAEKIAQRSEEVVVYLQVNNHQSDETIEDDDPYKDFVIPDDLMW